MYEISPEERDRCRGLLVSDDDRSSFDRREWVEGVWLRRHRRSLTLLDEPTVVVERVPDGWVLGAHGSDPASNALAAAGIEPERRVAWWGGIPIGGSLDGSTRFPTRRAAVMAAAAALDVRPRTTIGPTRYRVEGARTDLIAGDGQWRFVWPCQPVPDSPWRPPSAREYERWYPTRTAACRSLRPRATGPSPLADAVDRFRVRRNRMRP